MCAYGTLRSARSGRDQRVKVKFKPRSSGNSHYKVYSLLYPRVCVPLIWLAALFQLIAMGVYTKEIRDMASFDEQYWGYSFRLGWAAVFLYGASGLIFLVVATFLAGSPTKVRYGHVNRT